MNMNRSQLWILLILLPMVALMAESCQNDRKNKNRQHNIIVTVDINGKVDGGHRFTKINETNFYIDDIKYTAQEGDLVVTGYDEAFFKGEAKLITHLIYDGRKMEVRAIGKEAFRECNVLMSVVIPPCVTKIDDKVFYCCSQLASIAMPNSFYKVFVLSLP